MSSLGSDKPKQYEVEGQKLKCVICWNETFHYRKAKLVTGAAAFFDLIEMNKRANCFVCSNCGYIHWFLPK